MDFINIGKYVATHGIKGEIKIISDFEQKKKVFQIGNALYLGRKKRKFIITNYRVHKNYDMVCLKNINNINDILDLKGSYVYFLKEDLDLKKDEYLYAELIGMAVYDQEELLGYVKDYYANNGNVLLEVTGIKNFYIPLKSNYLKKVDKEKKTIETNNGKDLII